MHLSTGQLVTSLLGFNLGIELVQLLLVCLALPSLLVLARLPAQPRLRLTGVLLTATAAVGWLADRLGLPNPVARAADSAGSHTTVMLAALVLAALTATAWTLVSRRQSKPEPEPEPEDGTPLRQGSRPDADAVERPEGAQGCI
ncbi:HupE/UreJ family protein [Streptomyces sp. NPDC054834]